MSLNQQKWSELIDFNSYYKKYDIKEHISSEEEEKDIDINSIDFSLNNEKILNEVNKILKLDKYDNLTSLEILKKQDIISSYISKSFQNNIINKIFFIDCISFLKKTSEFLANLISQTISSHNYNFIKKKGCYADHYPHNMIYADCDALLECVKLFYENEDEIHNKEIVRCINTISYVIRHMFDELNNLCLYSNRNEHNKFHHIKTTTKKYNNKERVFDI